MGGAEGLPDGSPGPSDAEAVARARAGEREAFGWLVRRYQGRAFRLALRVVRDEELARDIVQESFLKAWRSLDRFEGRSGFYTWFYRMVMNLCIDSRRRDRSPRQVELEEERALEVAAGAADLLGSGAGAGASGPEAAAERAELRELLDRAIEALPPEARRTLELREIDGLGYAEIARCLGIPKGTVMSRLHYARRRLRAALARAGVAEPAAGSGGEAGGVE
jgi:RNA polymerase sigma-70 factor (ECF subfamily)